MLLSTAIERYFNHNRDLSVSLRRQRKWALNNLAKYAKAHSFVQVGDVLSVETLTRWAEYLREVEKLSAPSVHAHLSAARALDEFIQTTQPTYAGPAHLALPPRLTATAPRRYLAQQLMERLTQPAPKGVGSINWVRFTAMVHLLASSPLPFEQFATLKLADVEKPGLLHTGPRTTLPLNETTQESLSRWLTKRSQLLIESRAPDLGYLWVRTRATTSAHSSTPYAAGQVISARGLRLAFVAVAVAAAPPASELSSIELKDIRGAWL